MISIAPLSPVCRNFASETWLSRLLLRSRAMRLRGHCLLRLSRVCCKPSEPAVHGRDNVMKFAGPFCIPSCKVNFHSRINAYVIWQNTSQRQQRISSQWSQSCGLVLRMVATTNLNIGEEEQIHRSQPLRIGLNTDGSSRQLATVSYLTIGKKSRTNEMEWNSIKRNLSILVPCLWRAARGWWCGCRSINMCYRSASLQIRYQKIYIFISSAVQSMFGKPLLPLFRI